MDIGNHVTADKPGAVLNVKQAGDRPIVDLSLFEVVAEGNRRFVYLIPPGSPGFEAFDFPLVLKLPKYAERERRMSTSKRLLMKLFPRSGERVLHVEANFWKKLARKFNDDPALMPLPVFHGFVDTSEGRATLWEAICDGSGNLTPTLNATVKKGHCGPIVEALNRFVSFCDRYNVVAPDAQFANMVLAERAGEKQIILIDGFGDMPLISFRTLFPQKNRFDINKSYEEMASAYGLQFDTATRRFSTSGQDAR